MENQIKLDYSKNGVKVFVIKFFDEYGIAGSVVNASCNCFGIKGRAHSSQNCHLIINNGLVNEK